jgi:hypothetical protein
VAEPPTILSIFPKGVSIASKAIVPRVIIAIVSFVVFKKV